VCIELRFFGWGHDHTLHQSGWNPIIQDLFFYRKG
jgi:hypothetical protein